MFSLNKILLKLHVPLKSFVKLLVNNAENVLNSRSARHNIKILDILNKSSPEDLSNYNIPLLHIQNLINWKSKKGPFKSLRDVLEVVGFQEDILNEIGNNILCNKKTLDKELKIAKSNRRIKNLVVPDMHHEVLSSLHSAVAIHVESTGISWARLQTPNNNLTSWTCQNFCSLPAKMMPNDSFKLALKVLKQTPPADVYIFEASNNISPQAQTKQTTVTTHNQKLELISMLLALINTSVSHNPSLQRVNSEEPIREIVNRVFFLRYNIPARLFGTLLGSEKVSAVTAIHDLVENNPDNHSLPYSPVVFAPLLRQKFMSQSAASKELLAQALMLGVSFMDLYVRKNSVSYGFLNNTKGKGNKRS